MRITSALLLVLGLTALVLLAHHLGIDAVAAALAQVTWWEFALICAVHGLSVVADTAAWRLTLTGEPPPFRRLYAAKCAGEAFNVLTWLGSVGGEAVKAWVLRRDVPYDASVPSLILDKTALVTAQALFLGLGVGVAWGAGAAALLAPMGYLLAAEVVGVGGFILVQASGLIGHAGRLLGWVRGPGVGHIARLDRALRGFYRARWRWFLGSVALHLVGWLIGAFEALLILESLGLPASVARATVVDTLGSGVRFTTFVVPASLGTLEGANAAAFAALGWAASAGLAFTLVRRARQAVWIVLGVVFVVARGAARPEPAERVRASASGAH